MDALSRGLDGVHLNSRGGTPARFQNREPDAPWMATFDWEKPYATTLQTLDEEIHQFVDYITATPSEVELREKVFQLLKWIVQQVYSDASVSIFGSSATGLWLPDADLDLVVLSPSFAQLRTAEILRTLKFTFLSLATLVKSCVAIEGAKIPILKLQLTTRYGSFEVDISFGNHGGIAGAREMDRLVGELEATRRGNEGRLVRLVHLMKLFLREKRLNDTKNGGLGGFSIGLFVVSFLQMQAPQRRTRTPGEDLIDFLDLYGRTFEFRRYTITTRSGGNYLIRARTFPGPANHFSLQHPVDLQRDMTSGCRQTRDIIRSFQTASNNLTPYHDAIPTTSPYDNFSMILRYKHSALGAVGICASPSLLRFRANAEGSLRDWNREDVAKKENGIPTEIANNFNRYEREGHSSTIRMGV